MWILFTCNNFDKSFFFYNPHLPTFAICTETTFMNFSLEGKFCFTETKRKSRILLYSFYFQSQLLQLWTAMFMMTSLKENKKQYFGLQLSDEV